MITSTQVHSGINIGFHVWILFTFLTIFFFTFIAKTEKKAVQSELNNIINTETPVILQSIDNIGGQYINWSQVSDIGDKIQNTSNKNNSTIDNHNKKLLTLAITISSVIFFILIGLIIYFTYFKKYNIKLLTILTDNFFIAIFVGIIELLFFLNVALKYIPVTKSELVSDLVDRTEYHINKELT